MVRYGKLMRISSASKYYALVQADMAKRARG